MTSCVTRRTTDKSDDMYGFTPNWPHDWERVQFCDAPMSSLSLDTREDYHQESMMRNGVSSSRLGSTVDAKETNLPIYNINRTFRDMPMHNTVFVTPETNSELYLQCTLSARWLLIEQYSGNKLDMSSGGTSIIDKHCKKPCLEDFHQSQHNQLCHQTKKELNKRLSTLV